MKQFPKQNGRFDGSAGVEIQIQARIKEQLENNPEGAENICLLLDYVEDKKDIWLIYEVCAGRTLNESLFDVKGKLVPVLTGCR